MAAMEEGAGARHGAAVKFSSELLTGEEVGATAAATSSDYYSDSYAHFVSVECGGACGVDGQ